MKILKEATKGGKRILTVELDAGEKVFSVNEDQFYKLGQPLDDVVLGHIIADAHPVAWCSIEQKWVE
jgi:hypothetical protein